MVTFQVIGYHEIEKLSSIGRIRKLLNLAKDNKIILLQGRLNPDEEKELIKATMEEINKDFKGIELAVVDQNKNAKGIGAALSNILLGDRVGFTVIGPANIVKGIKKDPSKIELLMNEGRKKKKKR